MKTGLSDVSHFNKEKKDYTNIRLSLPQVPFAKWPSLHIEKESSSLQASHIVVMKIWCDMSLHDCRIRLEFTDLDLPFGSWIEVLAYHYSCSK